MGDHIHSTSGLDPVTFEVLRNAFISVVDQMAEQVRGQLEAHASLERLPFGAPVRSAQDISVLSSREKILLGLSRR